jgi:hypothetical protein
VVEGKRNKELNFESESRKKLPRIKMRTLILLQVVHTCYIRFQGEYESPMVACSMVLEDNNECLCSWKCPNEDFRFEKEYIVIGDPL